MTELEQSITGLYETFARYPKPARIEVCPCGCTKPDATAHLIATPLRDVKFSDLADYSFSAMTTQGSVNDYRYLLPRLFEGIAKEGFGYDPEILFGKLRYGQWTTWPQDEIVALKVYMHALWKEVLVSFPLLDSLPAFPDIEAVLASLSQPEYELKSDLQAWTDSKLESADRHLVQFVTMNGAEFANGGTLQGGFWAKSQPQAEALRSWLLQKETIDRISRSASLVANDGFEHLFEPALSVLQREAKLL